MKTLGLMMAATMAATMVGAAAHAEELRFIVDYGTYDPGKVETFDIDASQVGNHNPNGYAIGSNYSDEDFIITSDNLGNTLLDVADSLDNGHFGTGDSAFSAMFTTNSQTSTKTYFYNGHDNTLLAQAGEVVTGNDGTKITVADLTPAVSAAPEPSVWALMLAGVAMIGLTLRQGRRQRGAAMA